MLYHDSIENLLINSIATLTWPVQWPVGGMAGQARGGRVILRLVNIDWLASRPDSPLRAGTDIVNMLEMFALT